MDKAQQPGNGTLILASGSPRRKELLEAAGFTFEIRVKETDESVPDGLVREYAAEYLARKKAELFTQETLDGNVILTADTMVYLGNENLGKPSGTEEAVLLLSKLSGKIHDVITGVCIRSAETFDCFHVTTTVTFKNLSAAEINHYVKNFKPLDKAGAYGIQEWIGLIGIENIRGSYSNVVGLPMKEVFEKLCKHFPYTLV